MDLKIVRAWRENDGSRIRVKGKLCCSVQDEQRQTNELS